MNEPQMPLADAVIERALQGYAPETVQQASALVSGLMSVLPLDECERQKEPLSRCPDSESTLV